VKKIARLDDVPDKDYEAAFQYLSPRFDARRAGQIGMMSLFPAGYRSGCVSALRAATAPRRTQAWP
jgi:hypothetical protein